MDNMTIEHCAISGQWTAGETTWWQSGFKSGNGTFANVLGHHFKGCTGASNRYNFHVYAMSSWTWVGGSAGQGEVDFYLQAAGSGIFIEGVRSELSQRLLATGASSAQAAVSIKDVLFTSSNAAADMQMIQWGYGGTLVVDNVVFVSSVSAPKIYMVGNAGRVASVLVRGGSSQTAAPAYVVSPSVNAPFVAVFDGYQQTTAGQTSATWSRLVTTRAGVLTGPAGLVTQTANYTLLASTDDVVVFNGASLTATLPDPTTVAAGRTFRVKNINTSALTVNSAGTSKTIDGAASASITQWASGRYVSDSTQWLSL
jgi:hypothetical protein